VVTLKLALEVSAISKEESAKMTNQVKTSNLTFYMELARRLKEINLDLKIVNKPDIYAFIIDGKKEVGRITSDGELQGFSKYMDILSEIRKIVNDISDYHTAFYKSFEKGNVASNDDRLDYYKLLELGDTLLAGRCNPTTGEFQFVTWQQDEDGDVKWGNYFDNFENAKKDFASRSGLIDKSKQFSETEIKVIYQGLAQLVKNGEITQEQNTAYGKVIEKIEDIVPEITNHEEKEHYGLVADDELDL
jgi:hypothetical protein